MMSRGNLPHTIAVPYHYTASLALVAAWVLHLLKSGTTKMALSTISHHMLLVDDDPTFCSVMSNAMRRRGFHVAVAHNVAEAKEMATKQPLEYALVDLKMPGESGLILIQYLHVLDPSMRIIMLTGYAAISTAIQAIKLGATHYLTKPVNADEVLVAFDKSEGDCKVAVAPAPLSVDQLKWEHIQRVLIEHDGNVTAAARALNMHRRTLQRKLSKRSSFLPNEVPRD